MNEPEKLRDRARQGLEDYFRKRSYPQVTLGLVLVITGLAGFGLSYFLLRAGMTEMWLRYPIAVLGAYGIFLLLMRIWVEIERRQLHPNDPAIREALEKATPRYPQTRVDEGKGSWLDWLDIPDISLDEGCLPILLLGVVVGLVALLVTALLGAPALLAEVFVDAFLAGVLYRRLKIAAREHWLGTAIRKTWLFVLGTAALLAFLGLLLTIAAPGSQTIGQAIEYFFTPEK